MSSARRLAVPVLLAALSACASGGGSRVSTVETQQTVVRVDGGGAAASETRLTRNDAAVESDVNAPADQAFAVLPAVYESLGLTLNTLVTNSRTVGAANLRVRGRLGRTPLSRYLICGADATGLPHADSYQVTMTVLSQVTPGASDSSGSRLATRVVGSARAMTVSGNEISCSSTGALERAVAEAVARRTASAK